jgi:hypothetical protein
MSQPETQGTDAPVRGMPYEAALLEVIKGLHRDPILLFGIGGGILLVAVLAVTTSLAIVLVVAGLFVVVLGAHMLQEARRVSRGEKTRGENIRVRLNRSKIRSSDVGNADSTGGSTNIDVRIGRTEVTGSRIGNVGGSSRRKSPED